MDDLKELSLIGIRGSVAYDCPMSRYTTFRIGGNAAALVEPVCAEDVRLAWAFARDAGLPVFLLGNGSNLLVRDEGFGGVVIRLGNAFSDVRVEKQTLTAQAGALLPQAASAALAADLTGLEFASGIPGSVGGALLMNAGAYGGEMASVVEQATALMPDGSLRVLLPDELGLSYRHSALAGTGAAVLGVRFRLERGEHSAIAARMDELRRARAAKQPLELPSAGSAFKRPQGGYAAQMIDQCGLKGLSVGGAQVSEKHAGFIVNTGGATCADVVELISRVRAAVLERFGVTLEREVVLLGKDGVEE